MRIFVRAWFLCFLTAPAYGQGDYSLDAREIPPSNKVEADLRKSYESYDQFSKVPVDVIENLESSGTDVYAVKKGDTLWGISRTFFGDGFYWPKIWSFNPKLSNPHQIEIDDTIRFFSGDFDRPPSFEVVKNGDVEIPPASKQYRPLAEIPPSLPADPSDRREEKTTVSAGVLEKSDPTNYQADMRLGSYFAEAYPETVGRVREMGENRSWAGVFESVYVEVPGGKPGDIYTVINKESRELETMDATGEEDIEGVIVEYLGEVKLRQLVNEGLNLYRAEVMNSIQPIQNTSVLIRGRIPVMPISPSGRMVRVRARIVGGEHDRERSVMGVGTTIYLNVGKNDGVSAGDIVNILANEQERKEETLIEKGHRSVGRAKVVKVEQRVSTAVIVYSNFEAASGDVTL